MWHFWRISRDHATEALRLFERASDLDPNFAQPVAASGYTLFGQVTLSYTESPLETLEQALRVATQAVALDDKEAIAHFTLGRVQTIRGEYGAAISELKCAIDLNPSMALAHYGLAFAFALTGKSQQAISECTTAIRLSPRDPFEWAFYAVGAWASILAGEYEAAVPDAQHAIRQPTAAFWPHASLTSALAHLDRREEAKIALDKLLEIKPDFRADTILEAFSPLKPEALRPVMKTWIDGLQMAGLAAVDKPVDAD